MWTHMASLAFLEPMPKLMGLFVCFFFVGATKRNHQWIGHLEILAWTLQLLWRVQQAKIISITWYVMVCFYLSRTWVLHLWFTVSRFSFWICVDWVRLPKSQMEWEESPSGIGGEKISSLSKHINTISLSYPCIKLFPKLFPLIFMNLPLHNEKEAPKETPSSGGKQGACVSSETQMQPGNPRLWSTTSGTFTKPTGWTWAA